MTSMRTTLDSGLASPCGEPASASRVVGMAMVIAVLGGARRNGRGRGLGREGAEHLYPERLESTQKETLPHVAEGVKVEAEVVDRHQRRRRHLSRQVQVPEVGAAGGSAGQAAALGI